MIPSRHEHPGFLEVVPLVVFTWLALPAAGTLMSLSILRPGLEVIDEVRRGLAGAAAVPLAVGLLASLLHLGRPGRLLQVVRGLGRSPLSAEVVLAGLALAAAAGAALLPSTWSPPLLDAAGLIGALLLVVIPWVYARRGQPAWTGPAVVAPVLLGTAWGLLVLTAVIDRSAGAAPAGLAVLLAADTFFFIVRWRRIRHRAGIASSAWPSFQRHRAPLALLRLALADLGPAVAAALERPVAALVLLALGILMDRILFYGFALKQTTEAGVDRMEGLLQGAYDASDPP